MKITKSKNHSMMTDDHLKACLRLATNSYSLDSIQCKSSKKGSDHKCIVL